MSSQRFSYNTRSLSHHAHIRRGTFKELSVVRCAVVCSFRDPLWYGSVIIIYSFSQLGLFFYLLSVCLPSSEACDTQRVVLAKWLEHALLAIRKETTVRFPATPSHVHQSRNSILFFSARYCYFLRHTLAVYSAGLPRARVDSLASVYVVLSFTVYTSDRCC